MKLSIVDTIKSIFSKENLGLSFQCESVSLIGGREENQDYCVHYQSDEFCILILADGMGGHSGGKLASEFFSEALLKQMKKNIPELPKKPSAVICRSVAEARLQMLNEVEKINPQLEPNTTFVMTVVIGDQVIISHLGDSRCLVFSNNNVFYQTKDHSLLQKYLDEGVLSEEQAQNHPAQARLLKAISSQVDEAPEVYVGKITCADLPVIIFQMSDGFWQGVSVEQLKSIATKLENNLDNVDSRLNNIAEAAVNMAMPEADNATVQMCRVGTTRIK